LNARENVLTEALSEAKTGGRPQPRNIAISPQCYCIVAVTMLAAALRFFNVGTFAFRGDEEATYAQTVGMLSFDRFWPLHFLLTRPIVWLLGDSEFALRLLPATYGVMCIPLFYFGGRRAFGEWPMVFAGLFIALDQWHLFYSQMARYYSAEFLLSGMSTCLLATSLRTEKKWPAVLAGLCICVGAGFHPTAIWPAIVFGIFCVLRFFLPAIRQTLTKRTMIAFFIPIVLSVLVVFPIALVRTVTYIGGAGEWAGWGYDAVHLTLAWVRGLEIPLAALGGCWLLGLVARDHAMGSFCLLMAVAPLAILCLLTSLTPVSPNYAFSATPIWFIAAGSAMAAVVSDSRLTLAVRAGLVLAVCGSLLPSTISHHTANLNDGHRLAYTYLKNHATVNDLVFHNFVPMCEHYTGLKAAHLKGVPATLLKQLSEIEAAEKTCWFLILTSRTGIGNPTLEQWLARNATMEREFQATRFDYEVSSVRVYKFEPKAVQTYSPHNRLQTNSPRPDRVKNVLRAVTRVRSCSVG
jgi:hypothetical protein